LLNSFAIAMSDRLALEMSFQLMWDNRRALSGFRAAAMNGAAPRSVVPAPINPTDSLLAVALVANSRSPCPTL